jgi:hypothetical protein
MVALRAEMSYESHDDNTPFYAYLLMHGTFRRKEFCVDYGFGSEFRPG